MRGQKGIFHNLSILTTGQIVAQLANVAALVYLAGFLGPHWFGVVQIGVAFMGYALIVAEWGLHNLGIREVARLHEPEKILDYSRRHMGVMVIQTVAVLGLGAVVLPRLPFYHHDAWVFILYLCAVIPQIYTQSWIGIGLERMIPVGLAKSSRSLIYALGIFSLPMIVGIVPMETQRLVPAIFLLAVGLSNLAVNIPLARTFGTVIHPRWPTWKVCLQRWRESGSIGAYTLVQRVLYSIDILLLGSLASPTVAGNYAAAAKVMFFLVVAVGVLWAALLPRLSRLAKESPAAFKRTFNLYFGIVAILMTAIALGGHLVGKDLVEFLYKGEFSEAGPIFEILAISYAMLALGNFLGNTLLAEDRQLWFLLPLLVCSLLAIVSIRILAPVHGGLGASWGMLMTHGTLLLALTAINWKKFSRLLLETILATLPALLVMVVVVKSLNSQHVLLQICLGGGSFLLLAMYPLRRLQKKSHLPQPTN